MRFTLPADDPSGRAGLADERPDSEASCQASALVVDDVRPARSARVQRPAARWSPRWRHARASRAALAVGRRSALRAAPHDATPRRAAAAARSRRTAATSRRRTRRAAGARPARGRAADARADGGTGIWSPDGRLAYVGYRRRSAPRTRARRSPSTSRTPTGATRGSSGASRSTITRTASCAGCRTGGTCSSSRSRTVRRQGLFAVPAAGGARGRSTHDPRDLEPPAWSPGRHAHRLQRAALRLPHRRGRSDPPRDGGARTARRAPRGDDGDPSGGSFDYDRRSARTGAASRSRTTSFHGSHPDGRRAGRRARDPCCAERGDGRARLVAGRSEDRVRRRATAIRAVAAAAGAPEVVARSGRESACGGRGLAWSPDGTQLRRGRAAGISLITLGQARERARWRSARPARSTRRSRRTAARSRSTRRRRTRSGSRPRSWSRTSTAAACARSARAVPRRACTPPGSRR